MIQGHMFVTFMHKELSLRKINFNFGFTVANITYYISVSRSKNLIQNIIICSLLYDAFSVTKTI
jgi:hypothetical protein